MKGELLLRMTTVSITLSVLQHRPVVVVVFKIFDIKILALTWGHTILHFQVGFQIFASLFLFRTTL